MIIGIGIDIIEIERIRKSRERQGEHFHEKVCLPGEIEYCLARKNCDQHFAARFAAKEAAMKALGTGWAEGINFRGVEVVREGNKAPYIKLHGKAAELAEKLGIKKIHLSISHSDHYAVAEVVMEG